jgi:hypothetical protein
LVINDPQRLAEEEKEDVRQRRPEEREEPLEAIRFSLNPQQRQVS